MNRQSRIGSYEWCKHRNGQMDRGEKFELVRMLIRAQLGNLLEKLAYNSGILRDRLTRLDIDAITLPDSRMSIEAESFAKTSYSVPVLNHCYRTYFWGSLLGQSELLKPDAELLFVSSILHDLGFSKPYVAQACTCCFTIVGARLAHHLVSLNGWGEERAKAVYEAISFHLNPIVDAKLDGVEAKLLKDGATMDVIGMRSHCLPIKVIQAIHTQFPRAGFKEEILASTNISHPRNSRPHFLGGGFGFLAARNPLDDKIFNSTNDE
jgi:hypothetical protein